MPQQSEKRIWNVLKKEGDLRGIHVRQRMLERNALEGH